MSRVEKYIEIRDAGESKTGLTRVWRVGNRRTGADVGTIKWYGGFRGYCFYPNIEDVAWVLFDADCLRLVADFLDVRNRAHRALKRRVE